MPFKDLNKRRAYRRDWYSKNKVKEKGHVKRRKNEIRRWFLKFKSKLKCSKCGENHPATLDFHHFKSNKNNNNIALMAYYGYSIGKIKEEMKKCVVLCANCHRKIHYKKHINKL